jgi:peptidylprolyl isomerase
MESEPKMATEQPKEEMTAPAMGAAEIPQVPGDTVTTASGLKYIDVKVGGGDSPQAGQLIAVHYTGWLADGTKFDSSRDRGEPLRFPIGQGRVIKGWDEGLMSVKTGGQRILIIPPGLGYDDRGTPGGPIPPGATLIFDVELVEIQAATPTP